MKEQIEKIIEQSTGHAAEAVVSPRGGFGHYSTSLALRLAKMEGDHPLSLAEKLAEKIRATAPKGFFEKIETAPPGFVNFWLSPATVRTQLADIRKKGEKFGRTDSGKNKTAIVEYSSVNIAKPMHVGHLRNIAIGDALANLHAATGYKVVRWDYLGDWGTQFGKIIAAYKMWGDKKLLSLRPMETMLELYVRFHEAGKQDSALEARGREESRKLEQGDRENRKLWEWFRKESLKELAGMHHRLGVKFDLHLGESHFEPELARVMAELKSQGFAKQSEGAWVVFFDDDKLPPALIQKSDGTSLYLTRDIANLEYRLEKYKPAKILYVVGNEQSLNFDQLFTIARKMGLTTAALAHVKYGLVLDEGGRRFSTREGRTVTAKDIIEKATALATETVERKNPNLTSVEKKHVAEAVGIGAIKYALLRENRNSDIVFNWGKMLDFSGDGGPYLQYTHARLRSILRKATSSARAEATHLSEEKDLALIRKAGELPDIVRAAAEGVAPNLLTNYLYELATAANQYYENTPILKDENEKVRAARLLLVEAVAQVLRNGMTLLGITAPDRI